MLYEVLEPCPCCSECWNRSRFVVSVVTVPVLEPFPYCSECLNRYNVVGSVETIPVL